MDRRKPTTFNSHIILEKRERKTGTDRKQTVKILREIVMKTLLPCKYTIDVGKNRLKILSLLFGQLLLLGIERKKSDFNVRQKSLFFANIIETDDTDTQGHATIVPYRKALQNGGQIGQRGVQKVHYQQDTHDSHGPQIIDRPTDASQATGEGGG